MTVEQIQAPFIDQEEPTLRLGLAACRLRIRPGRAEPWVHGTYHDPGDSRPLRQRVGGSELTLHQERSWASAVGMLRGTAVCDLQLGTGRPYHLALDTGASDVDLDLSGVPLRSLELRSGAGRVKLRLDRPNPAEADEVTLRIGAGSLTASGLGNLAATSLRVDSGAAWVSLDLTGELRRHLSVRVSSGASGVEMTLPADRPARVSSETTLAGTQLGDGFVTREGSFFTTAEGEPLLTLEATVTLGALQLRTAPTPA